MTPLTLRARIRNGALLMLLLAIVLGAFAVPTVHRLGGAIRATLYRNYVSIEAAQHMHSALYAVQLAHEIGALNEALAPNRQIFDHWIGVELGDITEQGEAELAAEIQRRGAQLFSDLGRGAPSSLTTPEFATLHHKLDDLIELNRQAMFRADSRASRMSDRLAYEFAAGLLVLLLFGVTLAWTLAWNLSRPLAELTDHLRSFSLRGPSLRLGEQPLAELQAVAAEFNRMAERLEQFEKLNVDRLIYEKAKTEAIVESLEDGIILIDPQGVVTHINEVAAIVLGIERAEALGSSFDDLDSNRPHYLRVREALRAAAAQGLEANRVEVDLHVRGRSHTYVLKPAPLRQDGGDTFGTILILQDITYLRDKDRARTNLVATLSHELKTPLTSLALSAELLSRRPTLGEEERELVESIREDLSRMTRLANDLLDLARGRGSTIAVQTSQVDLTQLAEKVVKTFALQAEQKGVRIKVSGCSTPLMVMADPLKLSWVVSNLIANAMRYTPAGGTIALEMGKSGETLRLIISDTGPGITADIREHLFERFAQGSANGAPPGSAGLGLAIAKEIVEAHNGRIFVESAPGQGTRFIVELNTEDEWRAGF
jgi:NtrC-family two-component system sensor histidine kinase KinB